MAEIKLKDISTRAPKELDKSQTKATTEKLLEEFSELQNLLYAAASHALLIVIQGMDASGKDGAIRNVLSSVNPQGVMVHSFKVPTAEELTHDFLWRIHKVSPAKGMIQVFNRSHYEDILVTRVHGMCDDDTARERMRAINDFEELLTKHNNTAILKFYLHVSHEEQVERLKERIDDKTKQWKYNARDFDESALYDKYHQMYEDCFRHCDKVPWTIVPSDQNWYKEYLMTKTIVEALRALKMEYPGLKK
jgi:PPK2 family polyphosphate:nucleotide phosphotransferase